ncbi:HlyD family efflux transporter periplasmic adaptor subunit [Pseudomonas sp. Pseu.R1]|uniref:HlyD family efflux transporter periplasmic adaptor subunit n=1 Tax=Pseudomonas sp. Pseu.R1 TaxID=3379818 RepID=UPI003B9598DC
MGPPALSQFLLTSIVALSAWLLFFNVSPEPLNMKTNVAGKAPRRLAIVSLSSVLLVLLVAVRLRLNTTRRTDDAYGFANLIDVTLEVSKELPRLPITENQEIKWGRVLMLINPRPYQIALEQARTSLQAVDRRFMLGQRRVESQQLNSEAVHASFERAKATATQNADTARQLEQLHDLGFLSQVQLDQAKTSVKAASAELHSTALQAKEATAAISGADDLVGQREGVLTQIAHPELDLEHRIVKAPFNGRFVGPKTSEGQYASAGHPVFSLIDIQHWFVVAIFREGELGSILAGSRSTFYLMSDDGERVSGVVDSIGYGAFPDGSSG